MLSPTPHIAYINSQSGAAKYKLIIRNIKPLLASFVILWTLLGFINQAHATEFAPADFTVATYSIDAECNRSYILIKWINSVESNVTGFQVHSSSVEIDSGVVENRWINPIAVVAKGANQEYTVIDSAIQPNRRYTFRVYGFDETNLLSKSKQVALGDEFAIYCTRLPLTII